MDCLPNEIIVQILGHLKDDKPLLKQLSSVNRLFNYVTRTHLFKQVALKTSLEDTIARVQAISHSELVRYVKEVRIEITACMPAEMLPIKENRLLVSEKHMTEGEFNSFQKCINTFFAATKQTLIVIDVWTGTKFHFWNCWSVWISKTLKERILLFVIAVRVSLCANDMVALRSLNACILQGGLFEPFFRNSTGEKMRFLRKWATRNHFPVYTNHWPTLPDDFRVSRLKKNLQRITTLDMRTKFSIRDTKIDASEFLQLIHDRMPNLTKIHLEIGAKLKTLHDHHTIPALNLNTLSMFSLKSLSLYYVVPTEFSQLLRFSVSCWKLDHLSLDFVNLPFHLPDRWWAIFDALKEHPIKELGVNNLSYFRRRGCLMYDGPTHEFWHPYALCTGDMKDVEALNDLVAKVQANGGSVRVQVKSSPHHERVTLEMSEKPLHCFHDACDEAAPDDELDSDGN